MAAHPRTALDFEWDEGNQSKLVRRAIDLEDVRAVHRNVPVYRRNKRQAAGRWLMVGCDDNGRELVISVLWADERRRVLRPITGWPR
jgi:uncharacterized DUF497 family protein